MSPLLFRLAAALVLLAGAFSGPLRAQDLAPWFEVPELNAGLGDAPASVDRSTPRDTVESLLIASRSGRWQDAAHLLNLAEVPPERQAEVGPELARKLEELLARKVIIDWSEVLDRPDGLDAEAADKLAMAGQPRKSILLWSLSLDGLPASIRLNRLKPPSGDPVWVFSRQTVAHLPALWENYGPSALELALPDWARESTALGLRVWELIGLPLLVGAVILVGIGTKRAMDAIWRRVENPYVVGVLRAIRGPVIFGTITLVAWIASSWIFVFSGRIDAVLHPLVMLGAVTTVVWLIVNALDAVLDRLTGLDRSDLTSRKEQEHRSLATKIAAGRRALIVVVVTAGIGIVLASSSLFQSFGLSLIGTAGAMTLVLGFAARRILGNILASMQIAMNQSARIGDRIVWEDHLCHVERINFTFVQLRDWDGTRVIVPVEEFVSKAFVNWTLQDPEMLRILKIRCTHDADVEALRASFLEILEEIDQSELGDLDTATVKVAEQDVFGIEVWFCVPCCDPNTSWNVACDVRERLMARGAEIARQQDRAIFPEVTAAERRRLAPRRTGLAPRREEVAQQRRRGLRRHAVHHLRHVMRLGMREHPRAMRHAARFRIGRAIDQPPDPRRGDRGRAHRAGLQRHEQRGSGQPLAQLRTARADRQHLGMRGRIAQFPRPVAGPRQHLPAGGDQHRTHRHLAAGRRRLRLGQRRLHVALEHVP